MGREGCKPGALQPGSHLPTAIRQPPSMEMGQQHLPAVLWADSQTHQEGHPALGGQHRLKDGVLLLLWPLCEALPTSP